MDSPLRLLFVEDVPAESERAVRQFTRRGIACEWRRVDSETRLREQLECFKPHVVVAKFSVAELDGWAALACVRALDPDLPFVFVSDKIGEECAIEAQRQGASDHVLRNNLARLVPVVQRAVQEARLAREQRRVVKQLREIVEFSHDWSWELDVDRRIVYTNSAVELLLGVPAAEILRTKFLDHVPAEQRERVEAEFAALSESQRGARIHVQLIAGDGARRWLESSVVALFDDDGQITGYRGVSRDLTDRDDQQQRIWRLRRILKMVSGVNSALVRLRERTQLLQEICRIAISVGGYVSAIVSLVEGGQVLRVTAAAGAATVAVGSSLPLSGEAGTPLSVSARAVLNEHPVVVHGVPGADGAPLTRSVVHAPARSAVALPLRVDTTIVGAIALSADAAGRLDARELALLREFAANISFALQYLARQDAVNFLSHFDALTGLANRALFCERLDQRLARRVGADHGLALVVLDIERLGVVNDSAGRHVGDGLLQQVAARLRSQVDDAECLAHLGAGVFALVLPLTAATDRAFAPVRERIAELFAKPFEVAGQAIRAAARCGIAGCPEDGQQATALLEHAESALKSAKEAGEDFLGYTQQMHRGRDRQLVLEQNLRIAIEERQFELHYQPKVDIGSGRIVGLEALLRWNEPGRGPIAPREFLPVLEATHLIVEVGDWVIEQALRDLQQWRSAGLQVRVAVNVSPLQLRRPDFAERLLARIATGFNRGRCGFDIEIIEGALLQDAGDVLRKLTLLRAAGVSVAIDDFGTGYSSLSRLSQFPVDTLKIDRAFVAGLTGDPAAVAVVSTIIALARAFSLSTVAEGVETPEQLQLLRELGCQESQGYLHSAPLPLAAITRLLEQDRAAHAHFALAPDFRLRTVGRA